VWDFLQSHFDQIVFSSWQHLSQVLQAWALATVLAVGLAALVYRSRILSSAAFAPVGIVIAPLGFGVAPAVAVVTLFAILSILRNTIVGLMGVDSAVVDSARGIGRGEFAPSSRLSFRSPGR